jgi:hypothetical protein
MSNQREPYIDPPADIRVWCRCDCGKVHATAGIGPATVCKCGRRLMARAFSAAAVQAPPPDEAS